MTKTNIIIALSILLLLSACTTSTTRKEVDIFTGIEGLRVEFAKNSPPLKVFEESRFPVLLRIKNVGAYSIPQDNKALLSIGVERDYVPQITFEQNPRLSSAENLNQRFFYVDGKTQINPKGDELLVSFTARTGNLEAQSEQKASLMTATICYPYITSLSTTVCIDPDITGTNIGKKVCNIKEQLFGNGQGAPVAITKIETQMIPDIDNNIVKPQFLIFIENKGSGNSADPVSFRTICGSTDSRIDAKDLWNVAYIRAYAPGKNGEVQLQCCPNKEGKCDENENNAEKLAGFVKLRDRKDFVRCTLKEGVPRSYDAYTSPLRVEISYGYVQIATANFIIQKQLTH